MMTPKQRCLAVLRGERPDYIPWVARIVLWYNAGKKQGTLPPEYRGKSMYEIHRGLGIGILGRGQIYSERFKNVSVRETRAGDASRITYETPIGTVSTEFVRTEATEVMEDIPYQQGYMIKGVEDYDVVKYIIEHTESVPEYEGFESFEREIGENGVAIANIGRSPFQRAMLELIGCNRFFYELYDHTKELESLFEVLTERSRAIHGLAAESPAEIIWSPDNFTGDLTNPKLFEKYCLPYLRELAELMHRKGKIVASHTDGDMTNLLHAFPQSGVDVAEAFAPAPLTTLPLKQAVEAWRGRVKIWGGIPSVIFNEDVPEDTFEAFMSDLFHIIAPGDGIILGIGDNAMPQADHTRLRRVAELIAVRGKYPILPRG